MHDEQTYAQPNCGASPVGTRKEPCRAKTRNGGTCKNAPLKGGNGRCRMHNGRAAKGVEASRYEGKGYSPYVPLPLIETFTEMQADPQLASVRDELALSKVFIAKHLEHYGTVDNKETLPELLNMITDMKVYYRSSDAIGMANTIDGMERLITNRLEQLKTEDQIMERIDQRRKLVEVEQRISLQGERAITIELFGALLGAIFKAIEMGVQDKDERSIVFADIRQLVDAGT